MNFNEQPRLPESGPLLIVRLTDLFRSAFRGLNDLDKRVASVEAGGSGGSTTASIPEVTADPVSPADGQAWVERRTEQPAGTLLAIAGGFPIAAQAPVYSYFFSVKTTTGGIKKVKMA